MKARKKPIEIEYFPAVKEHLIEIMSWSTPERPIKYADLQKYFEITTLEGVMRANDKDVIIKGINEEVYPCKKEIFKKTYDIINEEVYPCKKEIFKKTYDIINEEVYPCKKEIFKKTYDIIN